MAKKRFTFADAKARIKELEGEVEKFGLNTQDNVYTKEENDLIKGLKIWAIVGPFIGGIIGIML